MPEFKLGQPPDERSELLRLLGRERGLVCGTVFEPLIMGKGRVNFWLQEGEEDVQEVDS